MLKLELNLDLIFQSEYFYTGYDIGGSGHSITIKAEDKEVFLDAWSAEWRKRAEELLEEMED